MTDDKTEIATRSTLTREDALSVCPYCAEDISPNDIVCPHCESELQKGQDTFEPGPTASCPFCAEEISGTDAVCPHCESEIHPNGPENEKLEPETQPGASTSEAPLPMSEARPPIRSSQQPLVEPAQASDAPSLLKTRATVLIALVVVSASVAGGAWFLYGGASGGHAENREQEKTLAITQPTRKASVPEPTTLAAQPKKKPDLTPPPDSAPPVDLQQPDTTALDIRSPDTSSTITPKSDISIAALLDPATPNENIRIITNGLIARGTNKELVAKKLNTRGMKFYKVKAYNRAVFAFELSHSIDSTYELAIYNRACVAGIRGDAKLAADWIGRLKRVGTPKARKALRKAQTDQDFDSIRRTPVFKRVIQ